MVDTCETSGRPLQIWESLDRDRLVIGLITAKIRDRLFTLPNMWDLETLGIEKPIASFSKENEAEEFLAAFQQTVKFENDRYVVTLPWIEEHPSIPTNKNLPVSRLNSVLTRLDRPAHRRTVHEAQVDLKYTNRSVVGWIL